MPRIRSGDAEISYEALGSGPPVVLLHPFPASHDLWKPAAQAVVSKYRVILPDLRGHGDSAVGDGPVTMEKHAADVARILDAEQIGRAVFAGVSIGGYALFEIWRKCRERVAALVLCNTKAQADTPEARAARLQSASDVTERGVEPFFESMLPRLMGKATHTTRPDLVEGALRMMRKMSPDAVAMVQRGMAARPDSIATLTTINVPTLIVTGDEDVLTGLPDAELMRQNLPSARMKVIAKAGHYSPWEQPEDVGHLLREFLDSTHKRG